MGLRSRQSVSESYKKLLKWTIGLVNLDLHLKMCLRSRHETFIYIKNMGRTCCPLPFGPCGGKVAQKHYILICVLAFQTQICIWLKIVPFTLLYLTSFLLINKWKNQYENLVLKFQEISNSEYYSHFIFPISLKIWNSEKNQRSVIFPLPYWNWKSGKEATELMHNMNKWKEGKNSQRFHPTQKAWIIQQLGTMWNLAWVILLHG